MDGIAATTEVLERADARGGLPPCIIVLTTFDLHEAATRAIRRGASGFVLKDADPEFLLAAIRTVHTGNAAIASGEYLSEAAVKTHISRILGKLSLRDRVQLVVFVFENGLDTRLRGSERAPVAHQPFANQELRCGWGVSPVSGTACRARILIRGQDAVARILIRERDVVARILIRERDAVVAS